MLRFIVLVACLLGYVNSDANYKLNVPFTPYSYEISIRPFFDTDDSRAFTFDGQVKISFTTTSPTNQIKFHSEDLKYTADNITVSSSNGAVIQLDSTNPLEFNNTYSFAYINLQSDLQSGVTYELNIVYEGPIRDDLRGFYRNYYIEKGVKKWLGATQMEPTHARKVFPCFDEPELKAEFNIIIDRPANYKPSLANTKMMSSQDLNNDLVRETFHTTPRMSTYLVAFLVSEFEAGHYSSNTTTGKEFGVFSRPEATNQTDYAYDFGLRVVDALSEYFGIDYYSTNSQLKLDHVALPNFNAGAMENWGLIKYRESLMNYVPEESTPYYKYRVAQIVAHETTHMWFGNLVTCHWWSNTWLNEGFANYFQDYITSIIEPDVYSADMLVTDSVYRAYDADESKYSNPITNENVYSPSEISGHFGTITYQKAGSVIRMMHHLLGDEAFRKGLNAYLTAHKFQTGYPIMMYTALEEGANATDALAAYNGARIGDIMGSWISQAGHPVLEVNVDYDTNSVSLTQRRFYIGDDSSDEIYKIPITYTTEVLPNFENTKPVFIMENKTHVFTFPENITQDHSWVIFNIQETGFYRVKYDTHMLEHITSALKREDQGKIHYFNRAKIVNDLFAFYFADEISFSILYDTLEFLKVERNYNVWVAAIKGLKKLRQFYIGTDIVADIESYALGLMENVIASLGYDVRASDTFETLRNRMQLLEFACQLGHGECLKNSAEKFRNFVKNGTSIAPSLRPVSYCAGLRLGNGDDYTFMWNRMRSTNVANEANVIGNNLGCSSDVASLKKYLVSMIEEDSPIQLQDLDMPLASVLGNSHAAVVIEALNDDHSLWKTIYEGSISNVYSRIAGALRTDAEINSFENWLTSCQDCSDVSGALQSLANARERNAWARSHQADVLKKLRNSAPGLPASMTLVVLSFAALVKLY